MRYHYTHYQTKEVLQNRLEKWRERLEDYGLKVTRQKTEMVKFKAVDDLREKCGIESGSH